MTDAPRQGKTNIWVILGLVFAFVFAPLGLVFSIVALVNLKKHPEETGKGLAIAALIISIVFTVIWVMVLESVFWFWVSVAKTTMGTSTIYQNQIQ